MSKGETTRQRIIEAAAPMFNQRGFAGCSMQDVMAAAGLKKGGLYRHFNSKEELAAEALRYALAQAQRFRRAAPGLGPLALLRSFIRQFAEIPSPVPGGCPILNTAVDADDGNALLRRLAREGLQAWRTRIVRIVRRAIEQGEIRASVDPRSLANLIIAALEGALMISRLEGSRAALADARTWLDRVLRDVALPRSRKHPRQLRGAAAHRRRKSA